MLLMPVAAEQQLPDLGASERTLFNDKEEKKMRDEFMRAIRLETTLLQDPLIQDYIEQLGYRLVAEIPAQGAGKSDSFTFFMIEDGSINAISGPQGHIALHSGLLLATETEDELAAVVAHEISHYTQRHIARLMESAQQLSAPTLVALLASMALSSQNAEAGSAALAATLGSRAQFEINQTREYEKEADRLGMQLLAAAGFDPLSMPKFFERLQQANRFNQHHLPPILATHPVTEDRIADSISRAENFPRKAYEQGINFYLAQARTKVLVNRDDLQSSKYFNDKLQHSKNLSSPLMSAYQYGHALAMVKMHQYKSARVIAEALFQQAPTNLFYRSLLAEIEFREGQPERALRVLTEGLEFFPANYALNLQYIQTLLTAGQPQKAQVHLQGYMQSVRPNDLVLYQKLSEVQGALGDTVGVLQTRAEIYYLQGSLKPAIEQLEYALKIPTIQQSISVQIQARIDQLKKELKEV